MWKGREALLFSINSFNSMNTKNIKRQNTKLVTICISTRRRVDGIKQLLLSILNVSTPDPEQYEIEIVVVENDISEKAKEVVEGINRNSDIDIKYFLEKSQGVCNARNRAVKEAKNADFCIFVDDDQTVDKNWLNELLECQRIFNSDGVYGANPPLFEFPVSNQIRNFHTPRLKEYGQKMNEAPTNCLLIRKRELDKIDGPFDLRLNYLGGEDIHLTGTLVDNGAIIVSNPSAIAYEVIPKERATISYVLKRSFRNGNTFSFVSLLRTTNNTTKFHLFIKLMSRLFYGILLVFPSLILCRDYRIRGIVRVYFNLGALSTFFNYKTKFYA